MINDFSDVPFCVCMFVWLVLLGSNAEEGLEKETKQSSEEMACCLMCNGLTGRSAA